MKKMPGDIIIFHLCTTNDDHMMYGFGPFYPTNNQKNPNFEKMKKSPGDIIILDKCTKSHDRMLYCSLDTTRGGCNYFSFLVIFNAFTHLTGQKIKIKKKK